MTISNGSQTGSGNVSYTAAANTTATARTATLLVAGRNVVITQAAPTPPVAPRNMRFVGGEN
jgi:hypothetical protein